MTIENVVSIPVTPAQARAIRKLALGSNKKSANELATDLFAQVVRGRFKAKAEIAGDEAGKRYDMIMASGASIGLTDEMKKSFKSRAEYISAAKAEYAEIMTEL